MPGFEDTEIDLDERAADVDVDSEQDQAFNGLAELQEVVLRAEGYELVDCDNDMFEQCSKEWHCLQMMLEARQNPLFQGYVTQIQAKNGEDCVLQSKTAIPLTKSLVYFCTSCNSYLKWKAKTNRIIAMLLAPKEDVWKAVILSRSTRGKRPKVSHISAEETI